MTRRRSLDKPAPSSRRVLSKKNRSSLDKTGAIAGRLIQGNARCTAWTDGDPPPESAIVEEQHVAGITYQRKFIACGKDGCRKGCAQGRASHGPYWYAVSWDPKTGKTKTVYVGKLAPSIHQIAAHAGAE